MLKSLIILILVLSVPKKEKKYFILAGDITCKSCVVQLHDYLKKKTKKGNLLIAFRDKGNIILNESGLNYFQQALPKAKFIFLTDASLFPLKEKYPYLLTVTKQDTLKIPYDSLFYGNDLNTKYLK
jgi:hypothetical protein